jgi:hypothetical protein
MTERELIERAQREIAALKGTMRELEVMNRQAGRDMAANAAMGLRGGLIRWHADASKELMAHYPEFGGAVIQGPGGGR